MFTVTYAHHINLRIKRIEVHYPLTKMTDLDSKTGDIQHFTANISEQKQSYTSVFMTASKAQKA
jgi:hypothetical protein